MERRLFFLMHRAHRALLTYANARTLEALGVSSSQLGTLYLVAKRKGASMTEVASVFDLNKSAVSAMFARLEHAGLLRREPDPHDGRGSRLLLTAKGEAVRAQSLPLVRRLTAEITAGFSASEVETITRFLDSLVKRCGEESLE
jgi:DNA-binding MarR family transcriptional regulator